MDELEALVCLTAISGLGSVKVKQLLLHYGTALQALQTSEQELAKLPGFGPKLVDAWKARFVNPLWQDSLKLAEQHGVSIISLGHPHYPASLSKLSDAPILLYVKGQLTAEDSRSLALIGTRTASRYGLETAYRFAYELAEMGWTIISGLARGIDTAAHQGALRSGRTLAVIGSGLANLYPPENLKLAEEISGKGCLISEFPMALPPDRGQFPQRNRIVSGMSMGVLLIEAPIKSGAMLTMDRAQAQQKPCFTIPGRIDMDTYRGNHLLLKEGRAKLVESSAEIVQALEGSIPAQRAQQQKTLPLLSEEELWLLKVLPDDEITIDELIERTQLPVQKIQVLIMKLILKKIVQEYPGKVYKRRCSAYDIPVTH